ncbi:MAG TPA: hypothetical protein VHM90_16940 [Phycisphaerae bacterium]|nr:hypothetical protein [Phycisphaerae bacterium]
MTAQIPTVSHPTALPDARLAHSLPVAKRHRVRHYRRTARRLALEELLPRAQFLSQKSRALFRAFYELEMTAEELAIPCGMHPRQMRRRLARLRAALANPDFLLAARFGPQLPKPFDTLAADHWVEGHPLRQLAADRGLTLARIRTQIARTRLLLVRASATTSLGIDRDVA